MNNLKLIDHKDYWLLVDTETIRRMGDYYLPAYHDKEKWKIIACTPKHKDAPLLERVLLMMPEYFRNKVTGDLYHSNSAISIEEIMKLLPNEVEPVFKLPKQEEDVNRFDWREFLLRKGEESKVTDALGITYVTLGTAEWACKQIEKAASQKKWSDEKQLADIITAYFEKKPIEHHGVDSTDLAEYIHQSLSPVKTLVNFQPEYEIITNSGLGYGEYVILTSDNIVKEIVTTIPQTIYEVGKVVLLEDYEKQIKFKTVKSTFRGQEVEILQGEWNY